MARKGGSIMSQRHMPIDRALATIRERGVFLCYSEHGVDLWTPHTPIPVSARRAVVKFNQEIQAMMKQGRMEVCPSRDLHRQYIRHAGQGQYICEICEQIAV